MVVGNFLRTIKLPDSELSGNFLFQSTDLIQEGRLLFMTWPIVEEFDNFIPSGVPGDQDGVEPCGAQKPIAVSNNFIIGIRGIGESFIKGKGTGQALFDKRDLVFRETDLFYKRETLKSLNSELFFQFLFFFKELVKRICIKLSRKKEKPDEENDQKFEANQHKSSLPPAKVGSKPLAWAGQRPWFPPLAFVPRSGKLATPFH